MVETKVEANRLILFFSLLMVFVSCGSDTKKVENGWSCRDEYMYDYVSENDSTLFDLLFHVKLNQKYKYKNLNVEFVVVDPKYRMYCDTISVVFDGTTMYGKDENHIIISDMKLLKGDYRFRVKQIMGDTLHGVEELNLRIVPKWGKIK